MGFLDKILKMSEGNGTAKPDKSIYEVLFGRIEYSIKSSNPNMGENELISKTKDLYLEMCKVMGFGCKEDIYKPIYSAFSRNFATGYKANE